MSNVIQLQKPWNGRGLLKRHMKYSFLSVEVEVQKQEMHRLTRLLADLELKTRQAKQDLQDTKRRHTHAELEII